MKSFKATYIFAAFVVLTVAYAYFFDYRKSETEAQQKAESEKIINFDRDQISSIQIKSGDTEIEVKKESTGWEMLKPVKDLADDSAIDDLLTSLTKEKYSSVASEGEKINWSIYGLEPGQGSITVANNSGEKRTIYISVKANFQNEYFAKIDEQNKVLVVGAVWSDLVKRKMHNFRNKNIMRTALPQLEKLIVKSKNEKFTLLRKDEQWVLPEHPDWQIDQEKARLALREISELSANQFVYEGEASNTLKSKYGLNNPSMNLEIQFKDGKTWKAQLAQAKDKQIYADVSEPKLLVTLASGGAEKILNLTADSLRNREFPFTFGKELAANINVQTPLKKFSLKKEGENWQLAEKNDQVEVDSTQVKNMLDRLGSLKVSDFQTTKNPIKLAKIVSALKLTDSDNKSIFEMQWGEVIKDKKTAKVPVKTSLFKEPFLVEENLILGLAVNSLIKEKAPASPETKTVVPDAQNSSTK